MKRSQINEILKEADAFIKKMGFTLPPFAYFTPEQWRFWAAIGTRFGTICSDGTLQIWPRPVFGNRLTLFTIRNGNNKNARYNKPYAEKLLISEEGQLLSEPFSFFQDGGHHQPRRRESDDAGLSVGYAGGLSRRMS
jgi:D-lyxose ketol-isomerase